MEGPPLSSLAPSTDTSPLARARIRATLTLEQAAANAGIAADEARWLEEGRLYRFADADAAIAATIAYAAALGALEEGARSSAARADNRTRRPRRRRLVLAAVALLAIGIAIAVATAALQQPGSAGKGKGTAAASPGQAAAPARAATARSAAARTGGGIGGGSANSAGTGARAIATLVVDTIDAAGRPAAARALAARVRELGYRVGRVTTARRADEPDTAVYFEPGGGAAAARLAQALGLPSRPLPGGTNPRRLVVVIGKQGLGASS